MNILKVTVGWVHGIEVLGPTQIFTLTVAFTCFETKDRYSKFLEF